MHLNIVPGDFIFAAWDPKAGAAFDKKVAELKAQGYKLKENQHDWLNYYHIYENDKGHQVTLTEMCV